MRAPDSTTSVLEPDYPPTDAPARLDRHIVCNLVIELLADSEAALRERVDDVSRDRDTYRELLTLALEFLHHALERDRRHRDAYSRALDELRALRASHRSAA